jgi:hypothetical protein
VCSATISSIIASMSVRVYALSFEQPMHTAAA